MQLKMSGLRRQYDFSLNRLLFGTISKDQEHWLHSLFAEKHPVPSEVSKHKKH